MTPESPRAYFADDTTAAPEKPAGVLVSKTGAQPEPAAPPTGAALPQALYDDRATIILALRLDGYTTDEICEKTGLGMDQVRYALRKARAAGKIRDVIDLIDNEAVPQAVENLLKKLRQNALSDEFGDAEVQLLKGRGVFQNFNKNKNEGGGDARQPTLNIAFINPAGGTELPTVIVNSDTGSVIGKPRED
jgi:hypothetical protein